MNRLTLTLALLFTIFHVTLGHLIQGKFSISKRAALPMHTPERPSDSRIDFEKVVSMWCKGLLPNGNFEQGPRPSQMKGTHVIDPKGIPNWEISGFVEYIKSGHKQGDMLLIVPEGAYAVRLGEEASIKTKLKVVKWVFYSLTFSFARTCAQDEVLNISVSPHREDKDWGILPLQTIYSSGGWDSYSWGFLAESNEIEIMLHNPVGKEKDPACGPLVDSIALKTLHLLKRPEGNLLKNGNFEEGPYIFSNSTWGTLIPPNIEDDHSPLPGWIIESLKAVKYIDSAHFAVPEGKRAVELIAGRESAIAQIVRTVPGNVYELVFFVGDAKNSCEGEMLVEVSAGPVTAQVNYKSSGKGGFKKAIVQFAAKSTRTRVRFLSLAYILLIDGSLCGPVIDNVRLSVVPWEP